MRPAPEYIAVGPAAALPSGHMREYDVDGFEVLVVNVELSSLHLQEDWRIEKLVRKLEAASGSVVGATGALYAVRRELLTRIPQGTILDDVYLPMQVVRQGKRVVLDERARAWDHPNLFLIGAGVFPTTATANPTLTLAALVLRTAKLVLSKDLG